jgi:hypothetical protein
MDAWMHGCMDVWMNEWRLEIRIAEWTYANSKTTSQASTQPQRPVRAVAALEEGRELIAAQLVEHAHKGIEVARLVLVPLYVALCAKHHQT